ncbi:response regulator [Geobacter sp. FeAm09]|uniref:response regulator n=1 Tax=Geobacter sp. FeAm09 TaxID=2597769 RepID=UPI0011EFA7F1|nr:response regulator [Geobacter sp. FeAm09]QEM69067.1 response regulator [Geobacter sp. FeAm09]
MELKKCLVVDDDELGREIVAQYLQNVPVVDTAAGGRDAVEKFQAALTEGVPYELILLDIVMPDMDGISAGKEMRKLEKQLALPVDKQVKIVMLTALNTPQDVMQSMLTVQSSAYLVKPVEPEKVRKTISQLGLRIAG